MLPSSASNFPAFKAFARLNGLRKEHEAIQFFDVKFYPYTAPGVDPVFAVVGKFETIVCRPSTGDREAVEVLAWYRADYSDAGSKAQGGDGSVRGRNSCAWSQDPDTGDPLLCVGGSPPAIRVVNVRTGAWIKTLIGHGKEINDLAVSPLSPSILASASMDYTVRFWSLDSKHEDQPCMLMCAGEGHKEGLLTLAFHASGRYLLTGGMDSVINLWVVPELPNEATGTDNPTILHYPHFSTSAIHTDYVDCVAFYHDLVLSKCANENKIVLWRIEGFDSSDHTPLRPPTNHEFRPSRSAFGGTYQRLLQFEAAETTAFYMRFSLLTAPDQRPMLALGNDKSKVYLWDLQSLEEWSGVDVVSNADANDLLKRPLHQYQGGRLRSQDDREQSSVPEAAATATDAGSSNGGAFAANVRSEGSLARLIKRYSIGDAFELLLPHKTHTVPRVTFAARQAAWSVGGEWLVVVGDQGMIAVFGR